MSGFASQSGKPSFFKPSPFGAPAPAPASSDSDESDDGFFSRSEHVYAMIAAEEEARKKKKRQQAEQVKSPQATSDDNSPASEKKRKRSDVHTYPPGPQDSSYRDHSLEAITTQENGLVIDAEAASAHKKPRSSVEDPPRSPSAAVYHDTIEELGHKEVINLDDVLSEASCVQEHEAESSLSRHADFKDELESFSTLGGVDRSRTSASATIDTSDTKMKSREEPNAPTTSAALVHETMGLPDPDSNVIISILITSKIPGTSPLIVQRKVGQRLKEPRLAWCSRQGFDEAKKADIVLTLKGKQVYDSTSCLGLGLDVDATSGILAGERNMTSDGDTIHRVHMEAMTRQMFRQLRDAKARPSDSQEASVPEDTFPAEPDEKRMRLILKSKGRPDVKLVVMESHLISRLIQAFRKTNGLEDTDANVSLYFDGEEMDPNASITDCDMNDMDTVEVYVK